MSKSPSLRRIQADIRELALDPSDRYHAAPLEDDMFEWHFTIRGADGTDFEGGVYHGRILLPPEYPFKPPNIVFLTPSGRFETNTKICLSFSAFHPELWQPAWGIRLILEALISFLPTPADGAIGALDWSAAERKRLATKSVDFVCPRCCSGKVIQLLPKIVESGGNRSATTKSRFQKEIDRLHQLQWEHEGRKSAEQMEAAAGENGINAETAQGSNKNDAERKQSEPPVASVSVDPDQDVKSVTGENTTLSHDSGNKEQQATAVSTGLETATEKGSHVVVEGHHEERVAENTMKVAPQPNAETSSTAAQRSTSTTTVETPAVGQGSEQPTVVPAAHSEHWLIDPVLQCTLVLLAVICYMLIRKGQALYEEIRRMDSN